MSFILEISGELACFTRPELKVERVSYPVITPSAARNILMAILWETRHSMADTEARDSQTDSVDEYPP